MVGDPPGLAVRVMIGVALDRPAGLGDGKKGGRLMFSTILVPLDGSPFAEQALPWALSLARRSGARLDLMRVQVDYALKDPIPRGVPLDRALDEKCQQQEKLYLEGTAKWLATVAPVSTTAAVVPGRTADGILERIQARCPDLVVMTTHGRGPLGRAFLGSVADEVLRRALIPVLLIRPRDPDPSLIPEPAAAKVLVSLDGSALAEQVLEPALELARLAEGGCTLLRVVEIHSSLPDSPPGSPGRPGEVHVEEARAYLEGIARRLRDRGVAVQTRVVVGRDVAETILAQARQQGSDVIALATHGRGGVQRLLFGSVADKVIRNTWIPVLVYRPRTG
jgi:nucleotide-binding universal stress UspA family protein